MTDLQRLSEIQTRHNSYKKRYPWRFNNDAKDFLPRDREALLSEVRALTERINKALALHPQITIADGPDNTFSACDFCAQEWPCATVAALEGEK